MPPRFGDGRYGRVRQRHEVPERLPLNPNPVKSGPSKLEATCWRLPGHIPESMISREKWIELWSDQGGLYHLPNLSEMLRKNCDDYNKNHKINTFVMGGSADLDTSAPVPELKRTRSTSEEDRKLIENILFPNVKAAIAKNIHECTQ